MTTAINSAEPDTTGRHSLLIFAVNPRDKMSTWLRVFDAVPSLSTQKPASWDRDFLVDGLREHVGTVIVEQNYVCKDHRNLYSNFFSKRFRQQVPTCSRLHFFGAAMPKETLEHGILGALESADFRGSYIGYCVIRPDGFRVIGRTVLNPAGLEKSVDNGYFCLSAEFKVHLAGYSLIARGYPYMSQDRESMVCAHVAIWGACRYLSQRYRVYKELYPYDIIQHADPRGGRIVPYRAMTYNDYAQIFTRFGCHPVMESMTELSPKSESFFEACAYVESGFPLLASNRNHVLAVIGHTIKQRRVKKDANGLISTARFVDAFIAVDDNLFPYQLLTWKKSQRIGIPKLRHMVVPLPEKVYLQADDAAKMLKQLVLNLGSNRMRKILERERRQAGLITRQFITTGAALKHAAQKRYHRTKSHLFLEIATMPLPHFVWVMELASVERYGQKRCLGEIVIDATAAVDVPEPHMFVRVANHLLLQGTPDAITDRNWKGDVPQFVHNLGFPGKSDPATYAQ